MTGVQTCALPIFMRLIYSLFIRLYGYIIKIAASRGNKKAQLWYEGRLNQWDKLKSPDPDDEWLWMHVASLGEYEQGLPVLEALRKKYPYYKILLTFFSPSGYEVKKDCPYADMVAYMPLDTVRNARQMVRNFKFKAVFFVKYEFWFNFIYVLRDRYVPLFYISTVLRKRQYFFMPWGFWFRHHLRKVKYFFAQNNETANLLYSIDIDNLTVTGDTRFDRVYEISKQAERFPDIEQFIGDRKCIIAGSSWPSDEIV